jgi:predicted transcriptional regulator
MVKKTITFNVDEADLLRIDDYAANLQRDRTFVLNQAVKLYIADAEREAAESDAAMRGPFYTADEVLDRLRHSIQTRSAEMQQRKTA